MIVTFDTLQSIGLSHLKKGFQRYVPIEFKGKIDLLFDDGKRIYAIMHQRGIHDDRIYKRIMILLAKLVRHYDKEVFIYLLYYENLLSSSRTYDVFKKSPLQKNKTLKG